MKHTTLIGPIDVIPAGEDDNGDLKELILHDPESGEFIHYKMTQDLATQIARKMKASNKHLIDEIERAQARSRLELPGQNGAGIPMSPEVERQMRRQG